MLHQTVSYFWLAGLAGAMFTMVMGHEIVGTVAKVDAEVAKYKLGDLVGTA